MCDYAPSTGDDGKVYSGRGQGSEFGPTFGVGDTIGCGINYLRRTVFFTLNGELLPHELRLRTAHNVHGLYPCENTLHGAST